MSTVIEIVVFGTTISALYALAAVGLTLIFGSAGVLNMAHGALMAVGAYGVYFATDAGMSPLVGVIATVIAVTLFSVILYEVFVESIEDSPFRYVIVLFLISFIIQEIISVGISPHARSIPALIGGSVTISGVTITWNRVLAFVVAWILMGAVWYFTTRTKTGQGIRAMSMDEKGAAAIGINLDRQKIVVWALSGALAAIAGYFYGNLTSASPEMGFQPLLLALVIIVVGGMGSIAGALVASYVIGMTETVVALQVDPTLQGTVSLVIVILILMVRPQGIFSGRDIGLET
jgi:branched-chain amino acid transport system permease protein